MQADARSQVDSGSSSRDADAAGTPAPISGAAEPSGAASEAARPAAAAADAPAHLAILKAAVPVISLRSAGRLDLQDGCIVATLRGERFTAVFPPGARLVGKAGGYTAVAYGGRSLPLGEDTTLPGGGAEISAASLTGPLAAACPKQFFVIGG